MDKNQKMGLFILLISRTFERTVFYMVMSIIIQFLTTDLELGAIKSGYFYSIFYASIGLVAIFSGLLGDLTNRIKVVKIGMIAMTILYSVLIFIPNTYISLLFGFILLGISLGLNNTNISVFVGNIFNERKIQTNGLIGFVFYSIVINIGALVGPMIAIPLKESYGFSSIFIASAILAGISLVLYTLFSKIYNKLDLFIEQKNEYEIEKKFKNLNLTIFLSIIFIGVFVGFVLNQRSLTFSFYIRDFVENGFELQEAFSNLEKYLSIFLLLIFAGIIVLIRKLNWNKIFKWIFAGVFFAVLAYSIAIFSQISEMEKSSQFSILVIFFFLVISETIFYPVISYAYYRSSPIKYKGLFQGVSYTIISSQLTFLGVLIYEKTNPNLTFIIFVITLAIFAISILIINKVIKGKLAILKD